MRGDLGVSLRPDIIYYMICDMAAGSGYGFLGILSGYHPCIHTFLVSNLLQTSFFDVRAYLLSGPN